MKRLLCALALVAFSAAPALADPKSDVMAAMMQFAKATTYHMSISGHGQTMDADIQPPSKMHMMSTQFEMIKIDATTWMKVGGKWQKFTMPGMDQMMGSVNGAIATAHASPDDVTVTDLGMKKAAGGGDPLHAYSVTNKAGKSPATIFLDGSRLVEVDSPDGSAVRFSKFNVPVDIEPPT